MGIICFFRMEIIYVSRDFFDLILKKGVINGYLNDKIFRIMMR